MTFILGALIAGLCYQIWLSNCIQRWAKRQEDALYDAAGADENAWKEEIERAFPSGGRAARTASRADAFRALDEFLSSNNEYLRLQRFSVLAPLLGVFASALLFILKARGFDLISIGETSGTDSEFSGMLEKLTPLYFGIGLGAFLAITNQFFLHHAGSRLHVSGERARTWFDEAIGINIAAESEDLLEQTRAAIAKLVNSIGDAALKCTGSGEVLSSAASSFNSAADENNKAFESLRTNVSTLTACVDEVRSVAKVQQRTITMLNAQFESMSSNFESAMTKVGNNFALTADETMGALRNLRKTTRVLRSAANATGDGASSLLTAAKSFEVRMQEAQAPPPPPPPAAVSGSAEMADCAAQLQQAALYLREVVGELQKLRRQPSRFPTQPAPRAPAPLVVKPEPPPDGFWQAGLNRLKQWVGKGVDRDAT